MTPLNTITVFIPKDGLSTTQIAQLTDDLKSVYEGPINEPAAPTMLVFKHTTHLHNIDNMLKKNTEASINRMLTEKGIAHTANVEVQSL